MFTKQRKIINQIRNNRTWLVFDALDGIINIRLFVKKDWNKILKNYENPISAGIMTHPKLVFISRLTFLDDIILWDMLSKYLVEYTYAQIINTSSIINIEIEQVEWIGWSIADVNQKFVFHLRAYQNNIVSFVIENVTLHICYRHSKLKQENKKMCMKLSSFLLLFAFSSIVEARQGSSLIPAIPAYRHKNGSFGVRNYDKYSNSFGPNFENEDISEIQLISVSNMKNCNILFK